MSNPEQIKNTSAPEIHSEQKGLSLKKFRELIEKQPSAEKIKQDLGDWGEEYETTIPEILQEKDKDKLKAYEEKKVEDLPKDWDFQLARLKELERKTADYNQKKEELKDWTDTFSEQKPAEVQEQIKQLEEKQKKTEEELNSQIKVLQEKLTTIQQEKATILTNAKQKEQELEEKLKQWRDNFVGLDLEEVKSEWDDLKLRPDIPIKEKEFYDDYARRPTLEASKLEKEELKKQKELVREYQTKNTELWFRIGDYLKSIRIRKYSSAEPILTIKQARKAIAELLEQTEQEWTNYLSGQTQNPELNLIIKGKKLTQAQQILEWIKEARTTLDYEILFERWSGGANYNEEFDFDGSLYLLGEWIKVKDFEVPQLANS